MNSVKILVRVFFLIFTLPLMSLPIFGQTAGSVSLENVVGAFGGDSILIDFDIVFKFRYVNTSGHSWNISNGFVVYSPDSSIWTGPVLGDTLDGMIPSSNFDAIFAMNTFLGSGLPRRDTIGIAGAFISGAGLPADFDGVPYAIAIGKLTIDDVGKHICIDTSFFRTGGYWKWAAPGGLVGYPEWDGPYCFTISVCCIGNRGDLDGDGDDADVLDLTVMIDYIYRGSGNPGTCLNESDIDANGKGPDVFDLTFLIDLIFRGGPPAPSCQ